MSEHRCFTAKTCDIEEALGFELPDGTAERWEAVGDIIQTMEKACV